MSRENSVRSLEAKTFSGFAARCETGSSTEVRASACVADSSSLSKSRETKHGACTYLFGQGIIFPGWRTTPNEYAIFGLS
jgi:hypothetical protein